MEKAKDFYILHSAYGGYRLYKGSVESAKQLYLSRKDNLSESVKGLIAYRSIPKEDRTVVKASPNKLITLLATLLETPEKEVTDELMKDVGLLKEAMRVELMTWLTPHLLNKTITSWKSIFAYLIREGLHPEEELSFLKPLRDRIGEGLPIEWVDGEDLEISRMATVIETDNWKPTAKEERVVMRILEFINTHLCSRNEEYVVVDIPSDE